MKLWSLLAVIAFSAFSTIQAADNVPQSWQDPFATQPAGTGGAPNWDPQDSGWEMRDGGYWGDYGATYWRIVPLGTKITFSCDLTVNELLHGDWLTAGIGLAVDEHNYWAVNLYASPEAQKRRRMLEMHECLKGQWLAESVPGSQLPRLPGRGGDFSWKTDTTYHFEIRLSPAEVVGRVSEGEKEIATFGHQFKDGIPAVTLGRPMLRVNGLKVRYSNAKVTVEQSVPEPANDLAKPPRWVSRPGSKIVKGSGFFRTALVDDGQELTTADAEPSPRHPHARWWLIDPEGKPFFAVGADHVSYAGHWCESLGYSPYQRNVAARFGTEEAWGINALNRLQKWGFNVLPAGHSVSLRHQGLPHILFASFGSHFARREWICEQVHWTGFPDVFSPRWELHCRILAQKMARESQGDPWCLGTFLDNELEWYGKQGQLVDEVFQRGPTAACKQALHKWLIQKYGSLTEVNRWLGTNHADEKAFLSSTTVPAQSHALTEVRNGFLAEIADRYFRIASQAMRAADRNHLVLGCRFAGRTPFPVLAAAGKYNDVYTFNTYPRVDFESAWNDAGDGGVVERVPRELLDMYKIVKRPMIITEWGFPALDSGLPCKHGAGMRVDTQEQKAACYRIFAQAMSDLPFMVGYHYFMWADEPAAGIRATFPEDSNYGLVNEKDETYETLVKTVTAVNHAAAARHAHSTFSGELTFKATGDALEIANSGSLPGHGRLRILYQGNSRVEFVSVDSGETKRVVVGAEHPWSAEFQNWDGTKQQYRGGKALLPLEVVNNGAAALENMPVVVDGEISVAAIIPKLQPGQILALKRPAAKMNETAQLELKSGDATWTSKSGDGAVFNRVKAGQLPLGDVAFAAHQRFEGKDWWTSANRVVSLKSQEQADAYVVEAVVAYVGQAGHGPAQFQAGVRAVVFKQGGYALVKPLWLENTDSRTWELRSAFWFCRPAIGGATADDIVGGPNVPMYYRSAQFCTDKKLGGCFGALGQLGGWKTAYYQEPNGAIHPDSSFAVEREFKPHERWTPNNVPYLWIFAASTTDTWREVARLQRQSQLLLQADINAP